MMRLTMGILEAMMTALNEQLAGDALQSIYDPTEVKRAERNAQKAIDWIAEEMNRRDAKKTERRGNVP